MPDTRESGGNAEQVAQRLENVKNRLQGQDKQTLSSEIDQIIQQVRQLSQTQQSTR